MDWKLQTEYLSQNNSFYYQELSPLRIPAIIKDTMKSYNQGYNEGLSLPSSYFVLDYDLE